MKQKSKIALISHAPDCSGILFLLEKRYSGKQDKAPNKGQFLYKANIRNIVTSITGMKSMGSTYRYDQLQRLKQMKAFYNSNTDNSWTGMAATDEYFNSYSYDANGNIEHLKRNARPGIGLGLTMDDFSYKYPDNGTEPWNRLDRVEDAAGMDYLGTDDIEGVQPVGNYDYDQLGQLTKDMDEGIDNIIWRKGDKKVKSINRSDQNSSQLEFVYDPFGVRILKIERRRQNGQFLPESEWRYTYYAHDANGQVMAVYDLNKATVASGKAILSEQHLYGASRLGVKEAGKVIYDGGAIIPSTSDIIQDVLGERRYEISNHLGNVNVVITDRKTADLGNNGALYEAVILQSSDFYPFGFVMPGRNNTYTSEKYRYQYNGMEVDNEVKGDGNSYTTEFRQYDPRLGRWLSLDPLMKQFPWMSPYCAFNNNPIYYIDTYGLNSFLPSDKGASKEGGGDPPSKGGGDPPTKAPPKVPGAVKDSYNPQLKLGKPLNLDVKYILTDQEKKAAASKKAKEKAQATSEAKKAAEDYKRTHSIGKPNKDQEFSADMWNRYGEYVAPKDLIDKLIKGEEITGTDILIEGLGIFPIGKFFTKGGKLFIKIGKKVEDVSEKALKIGCFIEGTKIKSEDGDKNIEEIKVGDKIWAFDENKKETNLKSVINTVIREIDHLDKLIIGKDTIYTTDDHPFYVSSNWKTASQLSVGDTLTLFNKDYRILSYKQRIDTLVTVYNFAVEDYHTYFIGTEGVLVHNNGCSGAFRFLTADELANRLGTTVKKFHDDIKPIMKKDFAKEMKKINSTNPDIGVDDLGNIVLKNPSTGKTINTNFPLSAYKD